MENLSSYGDFIQDLNESKKDIDTSRIRKNLMHELLDIPEDEKISDVYKSGRKLAEDLVRALETKNIVPNFVVVGKDN
jgi:hypothetical protein